MYWLILLVELICFQLGYWVGKRNFNKAMRTHGENGETEMPKYGKKGLPQ